MEPSIQPHVPPHMLILIRWSVDVFFCSSVIMDMSGVVTGTADLPSGLILPLSPEAAARVKTTSTAQGVYNAE